MNTQEKYAAIVSAFDGNLTAADADKVAMMMLAFYPHDTTIDDLRVSMREIARILKDVADIDEYWKVNRDA